MYELTGSVGAAAINRTRDVRLVQSALTKGGYAPGPVDGRCGRYTVGAILRAQHQLLGRPDGRVDVNGPTWRRLKKTLEASKPSIAAIQRPPIPGGKGPSAAGLPRKPSTENNYKSPATGSAKGAVDYKKRLPLPPRDSINRGLHSPTNAQMRALFGEPRHSYGTDCRPPTNQKLIAASERVQVGRNAVTGLRPAVASLRRIMSDIQRELPDLYPHLGSAGMMCCRNVRGSTKSITNHSWGTAVDITIDGIPEPFGERDVWLGLLLIGPIFNRHGWYWGAGYARSTDCHHFECGSALLQNFRI